MQSRINNVSPISNLTIQIYILISVTCVGNSGFEIVKPFISFKCPFRIFFVLGLMVSCGSEIEIQIFRRFALRMSGKTHLPKFMPPASIVNTGSLTFVFDGFLTRNFNHWQV